MEHPLRLGLERSNSVHSSGDNEEIMVIEINFGKGKKDDIIVHFGDNPVVLAEVSNLLNLSWYFEIK